MSMGKEAATSGPIRVCAKGDPLSPLLFNIVADALSTILDKAVLKHHITGILADLIPGGISHIQYADDMSHPVLRTKPNA